MSYILLHDRDDENGTLRLHGALFGISMDEITDYIIQEAVESDLEYGFKITPDMTAAERDEMIDKMIDVINNNDEEAFVAYTMAPRFTLHIGDHDFSDIVDRSPVDIDISLRNALIDFFNKKTACST
jgi:hypothetical protein